MRILFALAVALTLTLVSPAFCQPGLEILPAEATRKAARELDLKAVKAVQLNVSPDDRPQQITVTDPQTIALLVEGLKDATTTTFSNQVDSVEVVDKNDRVLVWDNFSMDYPSHAISPKFIEGLKAAGVEPRSWKQRAASVKAQREFVRRLLIFAPPFALLALFAFFIFKRKTRTEC